LSGNWIIVHCIFFLAYFPRSWIACIGLYGPRTLIVEVSKAYLHIQEGDGMFSFPTLCKEKKDTHAHTLFGKKNFMGCESLEKIDIGQACVIHIHSFENMRVEDKDCVFPISADGYVRFVNRKYVCISSPLLSRYGHNSVMECLAPSKTYVSGTIEFLTSPLLMVTGKFRVLYRGAGFALIKEEDMITSISTIQRREAFRLPVYRAGHIYIPQKKEENQHIQPVASQEKKYPLTVLDISFKGMRATCASPIPFNTPFAADIPVKNGTVPGIVVRIHEEGYHFAYLSKESKKEIGEYIMSEQRKALLFRTKKGTV
jgi:hypothetical protein